MEDDVLGLAASGDESRVARTRSFRFETNETAGLDIKVTSHATCTVLTSAPNVSTITPAFPSVD